MSCIPWQRPVFTSSRQNIKRSLSHVLFYSFIVFQYMYVILILRKYIHFRENSLIFLVIWGEAELFLGIWGAKANTFRETRKLFAGRRGDQCIIFRDQGSTDPPGGLKNVRLIWVKFMTKTNSQTNGQTDRWMEGRMDGTENNISNFFF